MHMWSGVKCNSCDVDVLYTIEPYYSVDSFLGFFFNTQPLSSHVRGKITIMLWTIVPKLVYVTLYESTRIYPNNLQTS